MDQKEPKKRTKDDNEFKENLFRLQGFLKIVIKSAKDGSVFQTIDLKNVVVTNTRVQESRLLAGSFLPSGDLEVTRFISRIGFGTSQIAETVNDTALIDPIYVDISSYSYPTDHSVQFVGELGSDDGNGVAYCEAGLLFMNPAPFLATRKTFPPIVKSSVWTWSIYWTLSFE